MQPCFPLAFSPTHRPTPGSNRIKPPGFSGAAAEQPVSFPLAKHDSFTPAAKPEARDTFTLRFRGDAHRKSSPSDSELKDLITIQRQVFREENPKKAQFFLNSAERLMNQKLDYASTQKLRPQVGQYAIPLCNIQAEYRGMVLTRKQVEALLNHLPDRQSKSDSGYKWNHADPSQDDKLGKQLLHGFQTKNGQYSYHGVPSASLSVSEAARHAARSHKAVGGKSPAPANVQALPLEQFVQMNKNFIPVVVSIENDQHYPPKGFLWKKRSDQRPPVILLDLSNRYQLAEISQRYGMLQVKMRASHHPATGEATLIPHGANTFAVPVSFNRQLPTPILLDTGASYVVITESTAKALGISLVQDAPTRKLSTANGEVERPFVELKQVSVGGLEVPNVEAAVFKDDSIGGDVLGMNFFRGIDFALKQGRLLMSRPD